MPPKKSAPSFAQGAPSLPTIILPTWLRSYLLDSIREFSSLIGQRVIVKGLKEDLSGEVIDVDEEGRLVLRLTSGKIVRHFAGEAKEVGQFGRKGFTTQAE